MIRHAATLITTAAALLTCTLSLAACASDDNRYQGTLRNDIMAIGGDTTGWLLEADNGERLEVNVSKVAGKALRHAGQPVIIQGTIRDTTYTERGTVPVLHAESIEPLAH